MYRTRSAVITVLVSGLVSSTASAQSFEADVAPLLETSCLQCHDARTQTPLNFERLTFDLGDHQTFRTWERVFERVERGEMPPRGAPRPEPAVVETALGSLKHALVDANLAARGGQRTPLRRLTRLEYQYTIQDLLLLDEAQAAALGNMLPAEADSGGFDTVAAKQGLSSLHVRSYLEAADRALDAAIAYGPPPPTERYEIDYAKSQYLFFMSNAEILGGGAVKRLDDGYATFSEISSTFLLHSDSEGFGVPYPGRYRVTVEAYPVPGGHAGDADPVSRSQTGSDRIAGRADRLVRSRGRHRPDGRGDTVSASWRPYQPRVGRSRFSARRFP